MTRYGVHPTESNFEIRFDYHKLGLRKREVLYGVYSPHRLHEDANTLIRIDYQVGRIRSRTVFQDSEDTYE